MECVALMAKESGSNCECLTDLLTIEAQLEHLSTTLGEEGDFVSKSEVDPY